MTKLIKFLGRVLGLTVEWLFVFVIAFAFLIRTTPVQTFLAHKAASYLSKELHAIVSIDEIAIVFIDRVAIDGLYIEDQQGDTLIQAKRIIAEINELQIKQQSFELGRISVNDAYIHIQKDKNGRSNHLFIKEYFDSGKPKTKKPKLSIDEVILTNGVFHFDDNRKTPLEKGMDYWHLRVKDIHAEVAELKVIDNVIYGDVRHVEGIESCGFELKDLTTLAEVSSKGAKLSNLVLSTERSKIYASKFNMLSDRYNSFLYFVDSVQFDAKIDSSSVNLDDISHFAYQLEGMNDQIRLSTNITDYTNNLILNNLDLRYADRTVIRGDFMIDDYREFMSGEYNESVQYAYLDIKELAKLRLPNSANSEYIQFNNRMKSLGYIELNQMQINGSPERFDILVHELSTEQGMAFVPHGLQFTYLADEKKITFAPTQPDKEGARLMGVKLGKLIKNKDIGTVSGNFNVFGSYSLGDNDLRISDEIRLDQIKGSVDRFEYLGYPYSAISIEEGSYVNEEFIGKIDVKDDYLNLVYDGKIDFKDRQHMVFTVDLAEAFLDNINVSKRDSKLKSEFRIDLIGKNANEMTGRIKMDGFVYTEGGREINIPSIDVSVTRSKSYDRFVIESSMGHAVLEGKLDLNQLVKTVEQQFAGVLPALVRKEQVEKRGVNSDQFTFDIELYNTDNIFAIFLPRVRIAPKTTIKGMYFGEELHFTADLNSDKVEIGETYIDDLSISQDIDSTSLSMMINADKYSYNDSLKFYDVQFKTTGADDQLLHILTWNGLKETKSNISWSTAIMDWEHLHMCIDPSYFHIKDHRWDIAHESSLRVLGDTIEVDFFELTRGAQQVKVEGAISSLDKHHLNFNIDNFDVSEVGQFISSEYSLEGTLNGWGFVSTPFDTINFEGDAALFEFKVKEEEVGDVYVQSFWKPDTKSIHATGDLIYKNAETFSFDGDYYVQKTDNSLDFDLVFDYTDIEVANAFMDPDVMSEIKGILEGKIKLHGTPSHPITEGTLNLYGGSVLVDLLGAHFMAEGAIEVDEYGFYANNVPVYDEEGNAGGLIGSVYHDNFRNFSFDLQFDLENDRFNRDPVQTWKPLPLEKFKIMDAEYSSDDLYYGMGYATGFVNIFGYTDNLEITVDLTTQKGTQLKIPMYGMGEISDENEFIVFTTDIEDSLSAAIEDKFDFTGVYLDLNFHATPDAQVEIIFDEEIGDIIRANGSGDINISVDNLGEIGMKGTYTVKEGVYDFALGIIRKQFFIEEGGIISWTGDPFEATLDLRTYIKENTNISGISSDQISSGTGSYQPVYCYLDLTDKLSKPSISFDIEAPNANEIEKSLIKRITSDKDELNRQFFSLLLFRKFQPLNTSNYSGNVAAEMITQQLNSILSSVSTEYNLGVNYENDNLGDQQYEFVVSRSFLDDRLIVTGTFGVESYAEGEETQSDFIGDVSVEYLINETGTFRGVIFNESVDHTVVLNVDPDNRFSQGVGLSYREDFNNHRDFEALQYFLDIFRKRENKRMKNERKRQQRPVPQSDTNSNATREDD